MKTIFIILAATLFTLNTSAQWTKITAIPSQHIVSLAFLSDTIFAASDTNLLYKSIDGGNNWDSLIVTSNPVHIISLKIIDNKIYVGTNNQGIFSSDDYGATWSNTGTGLVAVAGFAKFGNDVYAATLSNGVYVFNQTLNGWIAFNNSLPTFSEVVFTIVSTINSLLIGPGSNGTFYRYNFTLNSWNEEYYDGMLHPGLQINKLMSNSDTLFAVNGNRIIRSEDDGLNWTNDTTGSHDGAYRTISTGINKHYTLTNPLGGGTWIQERSRGVANGATWATNEEFLPTGFSYDILEFQSKLFLAKGDGLYTKSSVQGFNTTVSNESIVKIYPNPSDASVFNISSSNQINKFTITTIAGKVLFSANAAKSEFTIRPNLARGIYFVNLNLLNGQNIIQKIVVE